MEVRMSKAKNEIAKVLNTDDGKNLIGYRLINNDLENSSNLFNSIIETLYEKDL